MNALLEDLLPAKARKALYLILFVGGLALAAWQAADGDWLVFAVALFGSLNGALAAGNTNTAPVIESSVGD